MELTENLRMFLENGEDWERKNTSLKGVAIIKLPATKTRPASLAIEINPVTEKGTPMKRKGVMIMGGSELAAFQEVFRNPKVGALLEAIEAISPVKKSRSPEGGDVLEI